MLSLNRRPGLTSEENHGLHEENPLFSHGYPLHAGDERRVALKHADMREGACELCFMTRSLFLASSAVARKSNFMETSNTC